MSHVMRKPVFGISDQPDTNLAARDANDRFSDDEAQMHALGAMQNNLI